MHQVGFHYTDVSSSVIKVIKIFLERTNIVHNTLQKGNQFCFTAVLFGKISSVKYMCLRHT